MIKTFRGREMKKIMNLVLLMTIVAIGTIFAQTTSSSDGTFKVMAVKEIVSQNRLFAPGEGMRLVAFDIFIDRRGNTGVYFDIRVRDSDYRVYTPNPIFTHLANPSLPLKIDDDDVVRGWLVIAIPTDVPIIGLQIRLARQFGDNLTDWLTLE